MHFSVGFSLTSLAGGCKTIGGRWEDVRVYSITFFKSLLSTPLKTSIFCGDNFIYGKAGILPFFWISEIFGAISRPSIVRRVPLPSRRSTVNVAAGGFGCDYRGSQIRVTLNRTLASKSSYILWQKCLLPFFPWVVKLVLRFDSAVARSSNLGVLLILIKFIGHPNCQMWPVCVLRTWCFFNKFLFLDVTHSSFQDAMHITAILGESVVFNCPVEFPGDHPVPYVLQWEKKVGEPVCTTLLYYTRFIFIV